LETKPSLGQLQERPVPDEKAEGGSSPPREQQQQRATQTKHGLARSQPNALLAGTLGGPGRHGHGQKKKDDATDRLLLARSTQLELGRKRGPCPKNSTAAAREGRAGRPKAGIVQIFSGCTPNYTPLTYPCRLLSPPPLLPPPPLLHRHR